jgi:hypothetical protein
MESEAAADTIEGVAWVSCCKWPKYSWSSLHNTCGHLRETRRRRTSWHKSARIRRAVFPLRRPCSHLFQLHPHSHLPIQQNGATGGLTKQFQRRLALIAVDEENIYPIFMEFLFMHQKPRHRFIIFPILNLSLESRRTDNIDWQPGDLGFGAFTLPGCLPRFKLCCGVDAVPAVDIMKQLPDPETILSNSDVMTAFHGLYFQAENQAKAAYDGDYPLAKDGIWWILLVGPYWTPTKFGPFSEAELGVRARKPSNSADSGERTGRVDAMNSHLPHLPNSTFLAPWSRIIGWKKSLLPRTRSQSP